MYLEHILINYFKKKLSKIEKGVKGHVIRKENGFCSVISFTEHVSKIEHVFALQCIQWDWPRDTIVTHKRNDPTCV